MIRKSLFIFLLIFSCISRADFYNCKTGNELTSDNRNTLKLIKTYTFEYWRIAENIINELPAGMQKKGFVVGDFHFNNVGIYYDFINNRSETAINDFDDAGYNYLIIDLMKYISFTQKTNKMISADQLIQNYINGIKNIPINTPEGISQIQNQNQYEFRKDYQRFIENKKMDIMAFNKSSLSIDQKNRFTEFSLLQIVKNLTQIDYALDIHDSGSSKDLERYLFIGNQQNGSTGIIEFKKMKCSATMNPIKQDISENIIYIKNNYLNQFKGSVIVNQHIYQSNHESFLVRQKVNNPIKKLNIDDLPIDELQQYVNYYAHFLGQIHSSYADPTYINSVGQNPHKILLATKEIAKELKRTIKN